MDLLIPATWELRLDLYSALSNLVQPAAVLVGLYVALRGLSTWRVQKLTGRRIDISESALIHFGEIREVILSINHPMMLPSEKEILKSEYIKGEFSDSEKDLVAPFAVAAYRIYKNNERIKGFMEQKYLCAAYFGEESNRLFESVWSIIAEIQTASQILVKMATEDHRSPRPYNEKAAERRERYASKIWMTKDDGSELYDRFASIFPDATKLFGEYLKEKRGVLTWF